MRPNLFLVGAPKCGTSALHAYLAQHPDIFMSEPKEPHFFCTDVAAPYAIRDKTAYEALFASANTRVAGESSATYLYSKVAARNLYAYNPDALIIAMLRNPLEMLPSLHSQKRVNGTEEFASFGEALEAEAKRKKGDLEPRGAFPYYYDAARYSEQLERFFDVFPRENLHVIVFDDFRGDAAGVYERVLTFLGVAPFSANLKIINSNKRIRSRAVHDFLQNPESLVNQLPKPLSTLGYKALDKLNSAPQGRTPLEPEIAAQLKRDFTPELERLSELLDRDLSHWVR